MMSGATARKRWITGFRRGHQNFFMIIIILLVFGIGQQRKIVSRLCSGGMQLLRPESVVMVPNTAGYDDMAAAAHKRRQDVSQLDTSNSHLSSELVNTSSLLTNGSLSSNTKTSTRILSSQPNYSKSNTTHQAPSGQSTSKVTVPRMAFPSRVGSVRNTTSKTHTKSTYTLQPQVHLPPPRFFMGIFTSLGQHRRRNILRKALMLYNDSRVCPFGAWDGQWRNRPPDHCQLLYTFVIGANMENTTNAKTRNQNVTGDDNNDVPIEMVRPNRNMSLLVRAPPAEFQNVDRNTIVDDMTFFNIREQPNRDEKGKMATWMYFASQITTIFHMDYVIKCDANTFLHVDEFFSFIHTYPQRLRTTSSSSSEVSIDGGIRRNDHNNNQLYRNQYQEDHRPYPPGGKALYSGYVEWSHPNYHMYMNGAFYILSRGLAKRYTQLPYNHRFGISSRRAISCHPTREDVCVGYAILINFPLVHVVAMSKKQTEKLWKYETNWTTSDLEEYYETQARRLLHGEKHQL